MGWVASVEGEAVTGGEEARGHREAHYADSDPPDSGLGRRDRVRVRCSHDAALVGSPKVMNYK